MFGIPAVILAAYLAVKREGTGLWTAISVICWTCVSIIILGALALALGFGIALLRGW